MTTRELKSLSNAELISWAENPHIPCELSTRLTDEWVRRNVGRGVLPRPNSSGKGGPRILYNTPPKPR